MTQTAKFKKGQIVGIYNDKGSRTIYEVDEVRQNGSTWMYTFLDYNTKKPVFKDGSDSRYWQEQRWLSLAKITFN